MDRIGGNDSFDYDANGNMTARNKGPASQQTLVWDAQNRLSEMHDPRRRHRHTYPWPPTNSIVDLQDS